jgi:y4mF family transcriptional regulator
MNPKNIGKMVHFHRKKSGLTQERLGTLAGVGKTVVFDIEKGKLTVRLSTLIKVLAVLNIKLKFESPLMGDFHEES